MRQPVVLGIGNRLMGDDGIGLRVVGELERKYASGQSAFQGQNTAPERTGTLENLKYIAGETDTGYCLSCLALGDSCVIIDAGSSGKEPCSVDVQTLQEVFSRDRPLLSFHDFNLLHAMKRENLIKEGILITIEISSIEFSLELSPVMKAQFYRIVGEVEEIIKHYVDQT